MQLFPQTLSQVYTMPASEVSENLSEIWSGSFCPTNSV